MWFKQSFFKYATAIILILLIIFLLHNVGFLFKPFIDFIMTLAFPIILAGVLYYMFRPLMRLQEKIRIPRVLAIVNIFLGILFILLIVTIYVRPIIIEQVAAFTEAPAQKFEVVKEKTVSIMNLFNFNMYSITELQNMLTAFLKKINTLISENIVETLTSITKIAIVLVISPFILFYFLKDDHLLYEFILKIIPEKYHRDAKKVLHDADTTLSTFITGQLLVAVIVGVLIYIGYEIIGLNNAAILALFAMIFITIPYLGTFIAIIPALLVGLAASPLMALKVVIVMFIAHLLEANLISPQIMAQRLHIHPLLIMLILLASGSLYGIIGLFLATPTYALFRVIFIDLYKISNSHLQRKAKEKEETLIDE